MRKFGESSFEELRLADYGTLDKTNNASNASSSVDIPTSEHPHGATARTGSARTSTDPVSFKQQSSSTMSPPKFLSFEESRLAEYDKRSKTDDTSHAGSGFPTALKTADREDLHEGGAQRAQPIKPWPPVLNQAPSSSAKGTIGTKFAPKSERDYTYPCVCKYQSITFMESFEPFSFEELRLADYKKLNKTDSAASTDFGLPTAPATPLPEETKDEQRSSQPSQPFSFGSKQAEMTQAVESAALFHSQPAENETAQNKEPELSTPPKTFQETLGKTRKFSPTGSDEAVVTKSMPPAPAVGSVPVSDVNTDPSASRSFFGLPESEFKTESSSMFSFKPSTASAQTKTESSFKFTPLRETAAGNQTTTSWFPSMKLPKQDANISDTTSLFSSLPKTTIAADSSFSKISETKLLNDKTTNTQSSESDTIKTAENIDSATQQSQAKSQENVSDVAALRSNYKTNFEAPSATSSLDSVLDKPSSKIGNELSTDQSVHTPSLTDQAEESGYQDPFKSFPDMAASLPQPNEIADPTVKGVPKESVKPAPTLKQQPIQQQESTEGINPFQPFSAQKADPLQSKDTTPALISGQTATAASKPVPPVFKFKTNPSLLSSTRNIQAERQKFMQLHHTRENKASGADEQLRTTPLVSLTVKESSEATAKTSVFPQYAFLGCRIPEPSSLDEENSTSSTVHGMFSSTTSVDEEPEPVLLNTNTPWSAFICGSQGSGKSYTLSAIIENCLYASPAIGKLPKPLAGIVFHNNTASAHNICEAAQLVSLGVKVNVLVSRSNYHALSTIYKNAVGVKHEKLLNVQPLVLQSHHLTAERMHRLMAFAESETAVPLYMEVIMRILREMAITGLPFSYATFKANLDNEGLQPGQKVMMDMRLDLLESFLDPGCIKASKKTSSKKPDLFTTSPGSLTIVDLSDPFLDAGTTCTLFDILLSVFLSSRPDSGLLVCLDEAHKFMKNTPAAETFTENLLAVIREQRHNACRVVVATQEPTISPKLLDLCSMTFVHRFTSPDWMLTLKKHLAGASDLAASAADGGSVADKKKKKGTAAQLFEKIINLDVGESLLFAPSAVLEVDEHGKKKKLGMGCVRFKTRSRLGVDGGQSVLAVRE
ncbi:hypothetical protein KCU93_g8690, partial [Aureobasidium melanogenum]